MIRKTVFFLFFLVISVSVVLSAEMVTGGELQLNTGLLFYLDDEELQHELDGRWSFEGIFNAYNEKTDFFFKPEFVLEELGDASLKVEQLYLRVFPADFFSFTVGRFYHLPGTADFFSIHNFFHKYDYETFLTGDLDSARVPNDMIRMSFYFGSFFSRVVTAPFLSKQKIIDPSSPWFLDADIPKEISFTAEDGIERTYTLREISLGQGEAVTSALSNISVSVEFGGTVALFDFLVNYYHGIDNDLILEAHVNFPYTISGSSFDIEVSPVVDIIDTFGTATAFSSGGFRFWAEGAFTLNKPFATTTVSEYSKNTIREENPYLEVTGGVSYRFMSPAIYISAEYTDGWAFQQQYEHITFPTTSIFTFLFQWGFLNGLIEWTEVMVLSREDWSFLINSALTFHLSESIRIDLVYPFFWGKPDSNFGQFRTNFPVSVGFSWKF